MSRVLRTLARVTELGLAVFGALAVLLSGWVMSGRSTGLSGAQACTTTAASVSSSARRERQM